MFSLCSDAIGSLLTCVHVDTDGCTVTPMRRKSHQRLNPRYYPEFIGSRLPAGLSVSGVGRVDAAPTHRLCCNLQVTSAACSTARCWRPAARSSTVPSSPWTVSTTRVPGTFLWKVVVVFCPFWATVGGVTKVWKSPSSLCLYFIYLFLNKYILLIILFINRYLSYIYILNIFFRYIFILSVFIF